MRVANFFFLSFKYIRSHKARFFVTLIAISLLFTTLSCFTCAYLSGQATFRSCIEKEFAVNGITCAPYGYDGSREHDRLIAALNNSFNGIYSIQGVSRVSVLSTTVNGVDYPVPLFYYTSFSTINETITEGEEYSSSATEKIWLPRLNTFGQYTLRVGDTLPLTLTVSSGAKYELTPIIAGFHSGKNSVYISPSYAFEQGLPVSIPEITLLPQELSFAKIDELKTTVENILSNTYDETFFGMHSSIDGYFEEFKASSEKNTLIFSIAAVALAAFGFISLSNSLMMGITENSATLSLYKILGLKNGNLLAILCFEAVALILLSVALASLFAFILLPVSAYAGDFLWGDTLSMFGEFVIIAELPAWLPFAFAGVLSIAAILTTLVFFRKNGEKYVLAGLRENGL